MARFEVTSPDGQKFEVNAPDGATPEQVMNFAQKQFTAKPAEEAVVTAGRELNGIPRQLGLTTRYGAEGLANTAQIVTEPIRYLTDRALGTTGKTKPLGALVSGWLDSAGLPKPETATERVVGDATRLVAGAGGTAGLARLGGTALAPMAANLPQQLTSAAGAGLASGASREAGGSEAMQVGAGVLGGLAGAGVPSAINGIQKTVARLGPAPTAPQLDARISGLLRTQDIDYSQVPERLRQGMRAEMSDALRTGREIDPAAAARLLDFQRAGATPTRGMLSLDPVQITREQNLAKMAANSSDSALSGLPQLQNQNNAALINRLNDLGGRTETAPIAAGELVRNRIQGTNTALNSVERGAWNFAKNTPGYKQPIRPDGLNAAIAQAGDDALVGFLPRQITDYMAAFQTGQQPFTPQHYKNLRSLLSAEISKGGNEAAAARSALRGLESVPMRPITNPGGIDFGNAPVTQPIADAMRRMDAAPAEAISAVDRARAATAAKYAYQESSPLVRTALSDARTADPEKIAHSFILNGSLNDARSVAQEVGPQGLPVIRDALATYIKKQSLSGAADEVGKVSQSALNTTLRKIGEDKLRLFFTPDEVAALHSTGRVASYMQAQPAGSAVNNSNSGALMLGRGYDALKAIAGKVPFGKQVVLDPLQSIDLSLSQRAAQNVTRGLLAPQEAAPLGTGLLLPGVALGGLLSAPVSK